MSATYYLLKMVLCSGVLFGYYHLALRNRLFHQWNRFYLLAAVVVSLVLPLLRFEVWSDNADLQQPVMYSLHQADTYFIGALAKPDKLSVEDWLSVGYATVVCFFLAAIVFSLLRIRRIVKNHHVEMLEGIRFVNTAEPGTPFSFFRFVIWNKAIPLNTEAGQKILRHEIVHVVERHTHDKFFVRLVASLFWFNPFFWLIGRELSSIHEFIADKKSAGDSDIQAFAHLLLQSAYPTHHQTLLNPFFQTSIKRRIAMLIKIQNPKRAYLGRVLALPLLAIVVVLFSFRNRPAIENDATETITGLATNTVSISDTIPAKPKKTISSVDVRTKKELTITYTDGSSETMSENEANARDLINNGGYGNQQITPGFQSIIIRGKDTAKNPPLIIIDGEEMSQEDMNKIDPNRIQSIDVLKGESATEKYGTKGVNGVIIIKLKDGTLPQNTNDNDSTRKEQVVIGHRLPTNTDQNKELTVIGRPMSQSPNKEVVVIGKPTSKTSNNKLTVSGKPNTFQSTKEVTVIGYPTRRPNPDATPVFTQVEEPASIDKAVWRAFLEKNMLPIVEDAASKGIKDGNYTFNIRFIVEKDGTITNISVLEKDIHALNQKFIELMQKSPKWNPATQNGKAVRSYHTQPLTFQISEHDSSVTKQ